jgi:hypothetical protein
LTCPMLPVSPTTLYQRGGDRGSYAASAAGDDGNAPIEIANAVTPR